MALFSPSKQRERGTVIDNTKVDDENNQLLIKLEKLKDVPDVGDYYLVSFRKTRGVKNAYQKLIIGTIPDENNLLAFLVPNHDNSLNSNLITAGTRVNVKGPFRDSHQQAS